MRGAETMLYSCQQHLLFQWHAVTFSGRAPTTSSFLTKSKKSDDRHEQRIRHKHGRRPYLAVSVGEMLTARWCDGAVRCDHA